VADENPNVSGVAGRYATALFELAREEKSVDSVKADLDTFDAMITESADLARPEVSGQHEHVAAAEQRPEPTPEVLGLREG